MFAEDCLPYGVAMEIDSKGLAESWRERQSGDMEMTT